MICRALFWWCNIRHSLITYSSFLLGILVWITAFVIIGDLAAPGGQLFDLVVLAIAANFGGWLISLTTLPRLIGMLLVGILFRVIYFTRSSVNQNKYFPFNAECGLV